MFDSNIKKEYSYSKLKYMIALVSVVGALILATPLSSNAAGKINVKKNITVAKGKTKRFDCSYSRTGSTNTGLNVKVKSKDIAKVTYDSKNAQLVVKGLKKGTTKVTISSNDTDSKGKKLKKVINVSVYNAKNVSLKTKAKKYNNMKYKEIKKQYGDIAETYGGGKYYINLPDNKYTLTFTKTFDDLIYKA